MRSSRTTGRANDIITGLRALAKKEEPRLEVFDMNEAVREVILLTAGEAKANNVAVRTEFAAGLPKVRGDRIQLQQVILNLVLNAIQAIGASGERPRDVLIKTQVAEKHSVSVEVQDTGPGMDSENASHAFEAFYTTKSGGLGMGLSICRSIVEAHDGKITITPNDPRGLTVGLAVPGSTAKSREGVCGS